MDYLKYGAIPAVLVFGLAYYFYTPLPSNAVEPWKQIAIKNVIRVTYDLARLGEVIGYDTRTNIARKLTELGSIINFGDKNIQVIDTIFSGVPVRIYIPPQVLDNSPALIHIHGGGWALLSVDYYDAFVRRIAKGTGIIVMTIEFRRPPDFIFPIPFEDCLIAVRHLFDHACRYGIDSERIAISGDSSGGNIAMAVALNLSQEVNNKYKLKLLLLMYPPLQVFNLRLPSYQTFSDESGPFIISTDVLVHAFLFYGSGSLDLYDSFLSNNHTSPSLKRSEYANLVQDAFLPQNFFTEKYTPPDLSTGDEEISEKISSWLLNPMFAPLMASDEALSKLPHTYILLAEYDVLRDDGIILARRLENLKKNVTLTYWEGLQHGFLVFPLDASVKAIEEVVQYVKANI